MAVAAPQALNRSQVLCSTAPRPYLAAGLLIEMSAARKKQRRRERSRSRRQAPPVGDPVRMRAGAAQRGPGRLGPVRRFSARPGPFYAVAGRPVVSGIDYAALLGSLGAHQLERARRSVEADFLRLHGRAPTVEEVDLIIQRYWYRISDEAFELLHHQRRARERRSAAA